MPKKLLQLGNLHSFFHCIHTQLFFLECSLQHNIKLYAETGRQVISVKTARNFGRDNIFLIQVEKKSDGFLSSACVFVSVHFMDIYLNCRRTTILL